MANSRRLTPIQWTICVIAAIGFAFDTYELLMLPLILRPALLELLERGARHAGRSLCGAACCSSFRPFVGGIFGLLGGYLTDRLGRRRVLTWSILLYAFSAFAAGFSTSIWMLLFFRCTTFIGVCVEFVAAVAWLAELFPDPMQRERVLGYTQFFSSFGGILVAFVNYWIVASMRPIAASRDRAARLALARSATISDPHAAWRYTLMSGLIPAIPLILIRPFLPESPAWQAKRAAGTLKRPSIRRAVRARICGERRSSRRSCSPAASARRSARFSRCRKSCRPCRRCRARVAEATKGLAEAEAQSATGEIVQETAAQRHARRRNGAALPGRFAARAAW